DPHRRSGREHHPRGGGRATGHRDLHRPLPDAAPRLRGDMRSYDPHVRAERDGHVVRVTLDKPATKNACTGDMWVALGATFRDIAYSGARAVLLTGAGGDFCAGADISGGGGGSGAEGRQATMVDAMRVIGDVVLAVHDCPVPVVAAVDGVCVGAGLGLAL